jgi:hypothetical protein
VASETAQRLLEGCGKDPLRRPMFSALALLQDPLGPPPIGRPRPPLGMPSFLAPMHLEEPWRTQARVSPSSTRLRAALPLALAPPFLQLQIRAAAYSPRFPPAASHTSLLPQTPNAATATLSPAQDRLATFLASQPSAQARIKAAPAISQVILPPASKEQPTSTTAIRTARDCQPCPRTRAEEACGRTT